MEDFTTGLVQEMTWSENPPYACIRLGPSPDDTEALVVLLEGNATDLAYQSTMIDALARAMFTRREVGAWHDDEGARITSIKLETE